MLYLWFFIFLNSYADVVDKIEVKSKNCQQFGKCWGTGRSSRV